MNQMQKNCSPHEICRVCSSRATYDIFQIIPAYLHETDNEYMNWRYPISYYLHVILEKPIEINDGYPQRICVLCISYMKHAYTFKSQALKNMEKFSKTPCTKVFDYAVKVAEAQQTKTLEANNDKIFMDTKFEVTSDEMEDAGPTTSSFFTYNQTKFEEDDVTQFIGTEAFSFSVPETFKERKCSSCKRRFMFEESYNEHIRDCIQLKLTILIRDMNQLLQLKDNRCVSSHEFVRRVIFTIKKSVQTITEYDDGVKRDLNRIDIKKAPNIQTSTPNPKPTLNVFATSNPIRVRDIFSLSESENISSATSSPLCGIFMRCSECNSTFENLTDLESHNFQFHNQTFNGTNTVRRIKRAIVKGNGIDGAPNYETESSAAEMNNRNWTRSAATTEIPYKEVEMIKNDLRESNFDPIKSVKCPRCDAHFMTISHLDLHMAKKH